MSLRMTISKSMIYLENKNILIFILVLFLFGCSSSRNVLLPDSEESLVWPEPPEKPRIRYLGTISTEEDLKKASSFTDNIGELIFGKRRIGVLVAPYAIAVDKDNVLYVTDTSSGTVHIFNLFKRQYSQFGLMQNQEMLQKPVGIAIADNWIYIVDSLLHKVCVFDKNGKYLFCFGAEQLTRPSGIVYQEDEQTVYVVDTAAHSIMNFTQGGNFIRKIGSRGIGSGMFNYPTHMWIDKYGNFYVSDTLNYRVQVFSSQWTVQRIFGQQGDRPGNFAHPCGIATDGFGNIYVTDRQFENIQIFNSQGQILLAFGQEGTQPGQFWLPSGICIDDWNRIYVADSFNKRIQIFELMGYSD